jgi:hypothetical protein
MASFRRFAQRYLYGIGLTLGRTANPREIQRFLEMVRPVETEHTLVRLGGDADGGYLIPDDLEGVSACFSPGVSNIARFEEEIAGRGIKCFLADASVSSPPVENALFDFEPKFLGPVTGGQFVSLEDWVDLKAPGETDFILQMDIERAEYGVLLSTSRQVLRKFRIIVVEFHKFANIYDRAGLELIDLVFSRILQDFSVVHIHPNNYSRPVKFGKFETPPLLEFTFLRNDRIAHRRPARTFPHPLDRKNVSSRPELSLPRCWYQPAS